MFTVHQPGVTAKEIITAVAREIAAEQMSQA